MPIQVHGVSTSRHVRYRAVPRSNRIPAPSSRAYQQQPTRVEGADIVMQSSAIVELTGRWKILAEFRPSSRTTETRAVPATSPGQLAVLDSRESHAATCGACRYWLCSINRR